MIVNNYAGEGLNLQAVTELVSTVRSAEEFERELNSASRKINNLDLNEDGKVDYIKVTEIKKDKMRGYSLTVDVENDGSVEEQEIATIQLEGSGDRCGVQTHGNRHIYGNNHYYYHSGRPSSIGLWRSVMSDGPAYRSTHGHNNYPSSFSQREPMEQKQYSDHHKTQSYAASQVSSHRTTQSIVSPNRNKVASKIKAPLKNPTTSQRSYQKSNPSKSYSSRSSSSFGGSSSRYGSSSSSRSGSSFGGGK